MEVPLEVTKDRHQPSAIWDQLLESSKAQLGGPEYIHVL